MFPEVFRYSSGSVSLVLPYGCVLLSSITEVRQMEFGDAERISTTETAKLVRAALKKAFPGTKFSVKSKSYSGGSSVSVSYTDGPLSGKVDAVAGVFSGAGFDGMIDMKYHTTKWLHPDGSVTMASSPGTEGSAGSVPRMMGDPIGPSARLVRFGADYIQVYRDLSDGVMERAQAEVADYAGEAYAPNTHYAISAHGSEEMGGVLLALDTHRGNYGSCLARALAFGRDYSTECSCPGDSHYGMGGGRYRCAACGAPAARAKVAA